ncbi:hypothetical protein K440DRAFT_632223 [Wilcoxina mikolae CBS 423.85]|nr:hypothetical protein K440DRAFT_632223 [Wilcoxina mikolae CBS 423.85]
MAAASPTRSSVLPSSSPPHPRVSFQIPKKFTKMSITQTFYLAHKARGKLSSEASRSDHNLRLLVGHANLLDSLMIHLADAEAEQERWYYNTVRGNERDWAESEGYGSLATDYESDSDSDTESDLDSDSSVSSDEEFEEVMEKDNIYTRTNEYRYLAMPETTVVGVTEVAVDDLEDDEEDDDGMFELTRTTSYRPPSLCSDESDDEEDESHPPSPPQPTEHRLPPMSEKDLHAISHTYFDSHIHSSSPIDDPTTVLFSDRLATMIGTTY